MLTGFKGSNRRRSNRPQPQRAWKALGWGAAFVVVVNLAANYWLPEKLARWSDPPYHVRRELLLRRLEASVSPVRGSDAYPSQGGAARPHVAAAFGSSRFMGGIDGKSMEAVLGQQLGEPWLVVNFGAAGSGPVDTLARLNRLLSEGPRPDLVLIEVLPNQLNLAPGSSSPVSQASVFNRKDFECLRKFDIAGVVDTKQRKSTLPIVLWNYRLEFLRMTFPKLLHSSDSAVMLRSCDPCGTVPLRSEATVDQRLAATRGAQLTFQQGVSHFQIGGDGLRALDAALHLCHDHDLPAYLVIMPEGPTFRQWYRAGAEDELRKTIHDLAHRWNGRVLDCWHMMPEEAFIDSHHLLAQITSDFSSNLARQLLASREDDSASPRISTRPVKTESR